MAQTAVKLPQPGAFKNNDALPPDGYVHSYSLEELQEFAKCAHDPVHFIKTYVKIIDIDKGLVPFELYDFQEKMVETFFQNRFTITMCSRQVGKSTTVLAFFLHQILFNKNFAVCISANKLQIATDLLGRLKLAYEHLPMFLKQGVRQWARTKIVLSNGSKAFAAATSSSAVRGGSYNILLLDEFAFVPDNMANEFYASVFPTISSGKTTKVIMVSTPNGMNLFHKFWVDAEYGRNDFVPIKVRWDQVPGRDKEWMEATIRNIGGQEKFDQEYNLSFLSTGTTLIRAATLQNMVHAEELERRNDGYYRYKEYVKGRQYVVLVDTATGQGLEASAFSVIDTTELPYEIVATYNNHHITTFEYPKIVYDAAMEYGGAWILCEVNDIGRDVAMILNREFEYEYLMSTVADKKHGQRLTFTNSPERQLGLKMSPATKRSGCASMKALIESNNLIINDYRIKQQLSTFVQKGMSYEHEEGHCDDLVSSLVLFGWLSIQSNWLELTSTRVLDQFTKNLEAAGVEEAAEGEAPLPAPVIDDGGVNYPRHHYDFHNPDDDNWLLR